MALLTTITQSPLNNQSKLWNPALSKVPVPPVNERLVIEPDLNAHRIVLHSYSDLHFTPESFSIEKNSDRTHFTDHLRNIVVSQINILNDENQDFILVLNGDIFEIIESYIWEHEQLPIDQSGKIINPAQTLKLFENILLSNMETFNELRRFLEESDRTKIVFVIGNHDNLLQVDDRLRILLQHVLMPEASDDLRNKKIQFTMSFRVPCMKLAGEHGQRFDKYDYSENNGITKGDWLSYVKINVMKATIERIKELESEGLTKEESNELINEIKKLQFIRSATAFPLYLFHVAERYALENKDRHKLAEKIKEAISSASDELADRLKEVEVELLPFPLKALPKSFIGTRAFQKAFISIVSFIYNKITHNNNSQLIYAAEIAESERDVNWVTMGHTHRAGHWFTNLRKGGKVDLLNSGTWIPLKEIRRNGWDIEIGETELSEAMVYFSRGLAGKNEVDAGVKTVSNMTYKV